MKNTARVLLGAAVVVGLFGCPEEHGPTAAVPIAPTPIRPPPPGPPVREPVEAPKPKEEPKPPPAPTTPAGLTRSKVGDQVEFSWTRIGGQELTQMDQAQAMAMIQGGAPDMEKIKQMAGGMKPQQSKKTGSVVVTRIEPESPFTFKVDIKSGKDSETRHYAYGADIPLHEVVFHTDSTDPRKKMKVAGTEQQVVEKESRILAPDVDGLALSGGMVSETSPEESQGSVSATLVKFGTTKATAALDTKPKMLDTFEAPVTVALKAVSKFGIVDPEEKLARDAKLSEDIQAVVQPCMKDAKPSAGALQGSIVGGKIESLMWAGSMPPKAFDKCLRDKIKKLKLPNEETFINVPLPGDR